MSNEIGMHSGSDRVPGESDGWQALKLWPQSGPTQGDDAERGSHQPKPTVTSTHSVHEDEEDVHASTPRRDIAWSPEASQIPESMPRVRLADSVSRQIWQPAQSEEASNSQSLESGALESEREHTGWCSPASHEGLERSTSLRHDQSDCESRGTPNTGASIALNAVDDRPLLPVPFPSADERTDQASSTLIEAHITADVDRGQYPDTASSSATHSASSQRSFANRNASPMHAPGMEPIKLPERWSPPAPHDETSMRNDWESMSAAALKSKSALWGTIAGGAAFFSSTETTTVSAFAADGRTTSAYNQQEQHAAADAHASSDHWETSAAETRAEAASGGQAPTLLGEECLEPVCRRWSKP
ncbi:hypothetical protein F1559_000732 [Cyanidiococcus yangmingshanensis]|uniref:Uncharacterized protein n=1 Tax=Cyanidiococcus yangmingshanensis TaxID=2690220 RepID=A0A7J7IGR8_9RHOD|nr:hypothetical protein F1559_000732 [Cyanidiococcus yangmingshanensis]